MKKFLSNMSVKAKLVWMLILMSAIPLVIFIAISSYNMFNTAIRNAEGDSEKRSQLVEENIEALLKENFTGLRTLAGNPLTNSFLADPATNLSVMKEAVFNANKIFNDDNPTHVTNVNGMQLIRSDNLQTADISTRAYFKAAMQGKESISEVVTSKATGRFITVLAVPVVNQEGKVAGMLQRDYDLSVLQEFVKRQSDEKTQVFIVDKEGKLLAHSAQKVETEADRVDETGYAFMKKALSGESGIATVDIGGEKSLVSYRQNPQTGWIIVTSFPYSIVWMQSIKDALAFFGIGIILLLIFAWFAFLLAGKFIKPLLKMVDAASSIAQGNLVIEKLDSSSKDEIGQLAAAFNTMSEQLKNLVKQITTNAEQLAASSEELTANSEQSAQASNQVASSITEMAEGATAQMEAANEASAVVEEMSAGIQKVAANASQLADHSTHAADKAEHGNQAVEKAIKQMDQIENTVNSSAQVVAKLGEQSKEIGQIVDTISGIAGQTNLLALNAAIEAARAGEQGRGFAVVAEEVRKLAEQSQEAAKRIAELIEKIQGDTDEAVIAMNKGTQEVKTGTEVVNAAGTAFREIMNVVEQVSDQVREISAAIQQMATGSQQIVNSVGKIDDLSKKSASEAQGVSAATEEQLASMEEIASSSQSLAKLAQDLQITVSKFKV